MEGVFVPSYPTYDESHASRSITTMEADAIEIEYACDYVHALGVSIEAAPVTTEEVGRGKKRPRRAAAILAEQRVSIEPAPVTTATEEVGMKRPRRAAAILAEQRVQEVLQWERCKESSSLFKRVDQQINDEFERVSRGERSYKKKNVAPPVDNSTGVNDIPTISSDDEFNAADDGNDINSVDSSDGGSMDSFVVPDPESDDEGSPNPATNKTHHHDDDNEDEDDDKSSLTCTEDSDNEEVLSNTDEEDEPDDSSDDEGVDVNSFYAVVDENSIAEGVEAIDAVVEAIDAVVEDTSIDAVVEAL
jgi:hypothetical protein